MTSATFVYCCLRARMQIKPFFLLASSLLIKTFNLSSCLSFSCWLIKVNCLFTPYDCFTSAFVYSITLIDITILGQSGPGSNGNKVYSTISSTPEQEPYHQMQFSVISKVKVKLATLVEGDLKAPFSIATTLRCRGGCNSFPWIAPLYPRSLPYNTEC